MVDNEGVDVQAMADAYLAKLQEFLAETEADGDTTLKQTGWQLEQTEEKGDRAIEWHLGRAYQVRDAPRRHDGHPWHGGTIANLTCSGQAPGKEVVHLAIDEPRKA